MALRELLATFGIQVDDRQLKAADAEVSQFIGTLEGVATAVVGAFALREVAGFAQGVIEMGAHLDDLAQRLGLTQDELQRFQYEAQLSGVDAESAAHALQLFQRTLGEAGQGNEEAAQTFAKLGVSLKDSNGQTRSTTDLVADVADGFSKLTDDGQRTATAMKLFGRSGAELIPLLKQGRAGISKLSGEFDALGGGLQADTVKRLADADDAMDRLRFVSRSLSGELVAAVAPALSDLVSWITKGVAVFREFAQNSDAVNRVLTIVAAIAGIAVVVWGLFNIELIAAALAVALVVLVFEDLWTTMEGGDTVTKRILDGLFGVGSTDSLIKSLNDTWTVLGQSLSDVQGDVTNLSNAWNDLLKALGIKIELPSLVSMWTDQFLGLQIVLKNITSTLRTLIQLATSAVQTVTDIGQQTGLLNAPGKPQASVFDRVTNVAGRALGGGSTTQSNEINVTNQFTGASDTHTIIGAVRSGISQGVGTLADDLYSIAAGG